MTHYMFNQTQLAELFGVPYEEMDRILIEHGLKSGELATQKAIDCGYASFSTLPAPAPRNYWEPFKISELTGRKLLDEVGFWAHEVWYYIQIADETPEFMFGMMAATHAFDGVPEALRNEVHKRVDRELIGDRRQACKKCGRMTFFSVNGFCWRCLPDDPFEQQRFDYEAAAHEAADRLAADGWGALYTDYKFEPKDTDIELWNGAIDTAIDAFLTIPIDPSKCDKRQSRDIIEESTDPKSQAEFLYSGFEDHGLARCGVFLMLAYKTVADMLTKEAT
jgi:hypothetical protein